MRKFSCRCEEPNHGHPAHSLVTTVALAVPALKHGERKKIHNNKNVKVLSHPMLPKIQTAPLYLKVSTLCPLVLMIMVVLT
jgi:hypothetical protein